MSDLDTPDPDEPDDVVEGESDAPTPDDEPETTRTLDSI
jgi:hypothetical protein